MLSIHKLEALEPGQRRRKLALSLATLESGFRDRGVEPAWLMEAVRLAIQDPKIDPLAVRDLGLSLSALRERFAQSGLSPYGTLKDPALLDAFLLLCNRTRHALQAAIGSFPAEWDLIVQETSVDSGAGRPFIPGLMAYAEDIRSPFNLGSIFRTAEAFGVERLFLSPLCTPPEHPRAVRSAMGCIDYLPWERRSLEALPSDIPVFALETGGTPIEEFDFPPRGIVIVGSEELGVSPEALDRADYGRVSIPMTGIKASLNVGVAFGILMQAWTAYLPCSVIKAR